MNPPLIVSAEAENDLREARSWYEEQRYGLGYEFLDCVDEVFENIRQWPKLGSQVYLDLRKKVVRRFPYVVIYRIDDDQITIIAVYHSKRDPQGWKNRVGNG